MKNNYTLFYLYNSLNGYSCELISDELLTPSYESIYQDVFTFLDDHMFEISNQVVEGLLRYSDEILDKE